MFLITYNNLIELVKYRLTYFIVITYKDPLIRKFNIKISLKLLFASIKDVFDLKITITIFRMYLVLGLQDSIKKMII